MESVEYLGFLIEVVSPESGTYEYSVFDMTKKDKPEFPVFETDDVEFISFVSALDDAKSWIRDFLFDDKDSAMEHIENLYATKKALSSSPSVGTTVGVFQKLTVDVFNRPDCPEWAKFASVDKCNEAYWFETKPGKAGTAYWWSIDCVEKIPGKFDATDWQNSLIERPAVLKKLTVDVFDRLDCPDWANYAVVNSRGTLIFFKDKPFFEGEDYGCWSCSCSAYKHIKGGVFDATDWENSLIERPEKKETLPEWCKIEEWVFADPEKLFGPAGYKKIKAINGRELIFSDGCCIQFSAKLKQARLRPYNAEEMKALVGKVIENENYTHFINTFDKCLTEVVSGNDGYSAKELVEFGYTVDGKLCGVFEHLNDSGEWVE